MSWESFRLTIPMESEPENSTLPMVAPRKRFHSPGYGKSDRDLGHQLLPGSDLALGRAEPLSPHEDAPFGDQQADRRRPQEVYPELSST